MSGGVDSAVAAGLLVEAGYAVIGITMKMYAPTRQSFAKSCCGADDFDDARRSAAVLGIPHYVLDFEEAFRREVIDRFADAYSSGRTPNPCVSCNGYIKLGTLGRFADRVGAKFVATGHYARLEHEPDGPHLYASADADKDQSYALAQLAPAQLAGLLLPLGTFDKARTRAEAQRLGLPVHAKPESQDICFVEGGHYLEALATRNAQAGGADPVVTTDHAGPVVTTDGLGPVVTTDGVLVGTHDGISQYTVGQRRRLPATHFNDGPRYVTRIDRSTNTLVIGREDELGSWSLIANELNLVRPERFANGPVRVRAMTRYRAPFNFASARIEGEVLTLDFEKPERAVAPGQLVALYDEARDEVLAGATILEAR